MGQAKIRKAKGLPPRTATTTPERAEIHRIGEVVANGPITKAKVEEVVHGIIKVSGHAANAVGFMKPIENSEGPYPAGRYLVFKADPAGQIVFVDLTNQLQ